MIKDLKLNNKSNTFTFRIFFLYKTFRIVYRVIIDEIKFYFLLFAMYIWRGFYVSKVSCYPNLVNEISKDLGKGTKIEESANPGILLIWVLVFLLILLSFLFSFVFIWEEDNGPKKYKENGKRKMEWSVNLVNLIWLNLLTLVKLATAHQWWPHQSITWNSHDRSENLN